MGGKIDLRKIDGSSFLWVSFEYNTIKETKDTKALIMNESAFIQAIEKTVEEWPQVELPKAFRPLDKIMKTIHITGGRSEGFNPTVEIPLNGDYEIFYSYGISLPVEEFVIGAISYLIRNPELRIGDFYYSFQKSLVKKWSRIFLGEEIEIVPLYK